MSLNPPHPATRFVSRFPEKDAPPEIVRDFLAQELVPHYGSHEAAAKVAAKWVVGSGRELRDYPVWRYVQVFGPEDAWIVYRKVRPRYLDEWMAEKGIKRWTGDGFILCCVAFCVICFITVQESLARAILIGILGYFWQLVRAEFVRMQRTTEEQALFELGQAYKGKTGTWW